MPWIALTEDHIKDRLAEDGVDVFEGVGGGGNRLPGIIDQVTAEVRGYVAGCHKNKLGPAGLIPEECLRSAVTIVVYDLIGSVEDVSTEDESKGRGGKAGRAEGFLRRVSRCEIGIEKHGGGVSGSSSGCYGGEPLQDF